MLNLNWGQAGRDGIIGPPNQNHVDKSHPYQQRNHAQCHDLVLSIQLFRSRVSSSKPNDDDGQGESSAPPGDQERRIVFGFAFGAGRTRVETSRVDHG